MEQDIRYCELDGRRIAYGTVGEGPVILFGGRWVSHLEEEWEEPSSRAFFEELARTHRVVRYDRLGAGLSDRTLDAPPTPESETAQLAAVADACGDEPVTLFACSCAGLAASQSGQHAKAKQHFDKLLALAGKGEPRPEAKFIRQATDEDDNLQVVLLQRTAEATVSVPDKYLRLGVDSGEELINGFPATREELFGYRGIILGSVEASAFTPGQQRIRITSDRYIRGTSRRSFSPAVRIYVQPE